MPLAQERTEDTIARLRATGLRVTPARTAVLRVLLAARKPLTARGVIGRLPARSDRVTVYRTLAALADAGVAHRIDAGDRVSRYAMRSGSVRAAASAHEHPHFVCDACGDVRCLDDAEVIVNARRSAGRVTRREVTLHGTCAHCDDAT